mmetsp:Transcript_20822/g.48072  ORF Transcript_20822/g.48072 Transcript_20822/m.48072 type:complete len:142 (-) Transcript_20822:79-504(-)
MALHHHPGILLVRLAGVDSHGQSTCHFETRCADFSTYRSCDITSAGTGTRLELEEPRRATATTMNSSSGESETTRIDALDIPMETSTSTKQPADTNDAAEYSFHQKHWTGKGQSERATFVLSPLTLWTFGMRHTMYSQCTE